MAFLTVNWLGILCAAIAGWLFGAVYYNALGTAWMAAQGKTKEQCKAEFDAKRGVSKFAPFILAFIATLIIGWVLYGLLAHLNAFSVRGGMISGVLCWFGFVLTTLVVNNAFAGRSAKLTVIDAGHWLGGLVIIGAIVGWFGP
ncbi:MAG: DUF1761 domain-containing protein [Pseudolabrys sp.]